MVENNNLRPPILVSPLMGRDERNNKMLKSRMWKNSTLFKRP